MSSVSTRPYTVLDVDAHLLDERLGELELAYCAAFGGAPWCEDVGESRNFVLRLLAHAQAPGFRCRLAIETRTGRLLGFAYGLATRDPGTDPWAAPLAIGLGPAFTAKVLAGAFQLAELAVWPTARRQGIGGCLHDSLLDALPQDRAWLLTSPQAEAAVALYQARGWRPAATVVVPGRAMARTVMALDVPRTSAGTTMRPHPSTPDW